MSVCLEPVGASCHNFGMMRSRLHLTIVATLILVGIGAAQRARGADLDPTGRVISVVHRLAPHEEAEIGVSENRRTLFVVLWTRHRMGRGRPIRIDDQRVDVFDVAQPRMPRRIATVSLSDAFKDASPAGGSLFIPGVAGKFKGGLVLTGPPPGLSRIKGTRGFVSDRTGRQAITTDLSTIYVWNLGTTPPRMTASVGLGAEPLAARFLAVPNVLAVLNTQDVELISIAPSSYDPVRLQAAYRLLRARYAEARARRGGKPEDVDAAIDLYAQLVAALKEAGVTVLMSNSGGRLPSATRIQILNEYGLWLSRTNEPWKAIPVLTKVVDLDPGRAVAQRDLANAALKSLPFAGTWQEKRALSETVVRSRTAYQRLTGKALPGTAAFAAFNVATAAHDDVCDYVAGFYNRGRQAEMFGFHNPVDIAGDGKLRYVYIYYDGTANVPRIVATAKPLTRHELDYGWPESDVNFFGSTDNGRVEFGAELHVLPFHDRYYVVKAFRGPSAVYWPNHGAVCRFTAHYTPVLTEDRDSGICARAAAGRRFKRVPTHDLGYTRELPRAEALIQRGPVQLGAEADVALDPGAGSVRVGYFGVASTTGPGCDLGGIVFLDKDRVEDSPRNRALLSLESKTLGCLGSTAFLVRVAGETLIEMDSGTWRGNGIVARSLFRLHGNDVMPVCRVEQRATYVPMQIRGGHHPSKP